MSSDKATFGVGVTSEDSWSTSNSHNLANAFECDISLLHLDVSQEQSRGDSQ